MAKTNKVVVARQSVLRKYAHKFFNRFKFDYFLFIPMIIAVLICDQLTKFFLDSLDIEILNNIVNFQSVHNYGAGWSILSGKTIFLIVLTSVFIIALFVFYAMWKQKSKLFTISIALVIGGGIGNLIDRIWFGYVRDFVKLEFINFPIFNIADMSLTIGVIFLMLYFLFVYTKQNQKLLKCKFHKLKIKIPNQKKLNIYSFEQIKTNRIEEQLQNFAGNLTQHNKKTLIHNGKNKQKSKMQCKVKK